MCAKLLEKNPIFEAKITVYTTRDTVIMLIVVAPIPYKREVVVGHHSNVEEKLIGIIEKMLRNCRPSLPHHNDISFVPFGCKIIDETKIAKNLANGISRST